jgi:hypothetical protein
MRQDAGEDGNLEGIWHKGYSAGAEWLYRNPFPYASLSDDEIAIATVLQDMQDSVEGGDEVYGFAEAAQDQALSLAIKWKPAGRWRSGGSLGRASGPLNGR